MNVLSWLMAKVSEFLRGTMKKRRGRLVEKSREAGTYEGDSLSAARKFEEDYKAATRLLKKRMDSRFPDNYHARPSAGSENTYDHGEERAAAIDTMSAAIATALRNGATVKQAAAAGAASVSI
jgi:hypothetical protein